MFDIEQERGIIDGKLFDIKITIVATLLFVANRRSARTSLATTSGAAVLASIGLRKDVMGGLEYWLGRVLAFAFMTLMFFALYKYLPNRRIRSKTALVAALFTSVAVRGRAHGVHDLHDLVQSGLALHRHARRGIVVVVWVYYAALIFILGGEVGQVYELRRVRQLQREVFTD